MHRLLMTAAALTALMAAAAGHRAEAFPAGTLPNANPAQNVAICFYPDGWRGPGFYQCGYRLRVGEGWVRERDDHDRDRDRHDRDRDHDRGHDRDHDRDYGR